MPVVLTQNVATADGHSYDDVVGLRYEYPQQYRSRVRTGDRFVYYRGRRGAPPGAERYSYLGAGVIGEIESAPDGRRLVATIEDYEAFPTPVPFKVAGAYIEDVPDRRGSATGVYFRGNSIRLISEEAFQRILGIGVEDSEAREAPTVSGNESGFPESQLARAVDEAGMAIALRLAIERWPEAMVTRMPHSNPGFDLLVERADGVWYVEVKSTTLPEPRFFISEGERLFADAHRSRYSLLVIFLIRLTRAGAERYLWRDGRLVGNDLALVPRLWTGRLTSQDGCPERPSGR